MAKARTTAFFCSECGYESSKWTGQCPACKAWNTMVEEPVARPAKAGEKNAGAFRVSFGGVVPAPSEEKKGKILDCVQTGYKLNDKVIRHAKVVVAQ